MHLFPAVRELVSAGLILRRSVEGFCLLEQGRADGPAVYSPIKIAVCRRHGPTALRFMGNHSTNCCAQNSEQPSTPDSNQKLESIDTAQPCTPSKPADYVNVIVWVSQINHSQYRSPSYFMRHVNVIQVQIQYLQAYKLRQFVVLIYKIDHCSKFTAEHLKMLTALKTAPITWEMS